MSRKIAGLKKELQLAIARISRGGADARGKGQDMKHETVEIESSGESGLKPDASGSEARRPACKRGM